MRGSSSGQGGLGGKSDFFFVVRAFNETTSDLAPYMEGAVSHRVALTTSISGKRSTQASKLGFVQRNKRLERLGLELGFGG